MSYIFQHICRIVISRDHIQLIRRALAEPDVVSSDTDTILGRADLWDGRYIEARLCGRPGQTALLAVVRKYRASPLVSTRPSMPLYTQFRPAIPRPASAASRLILASSMMAVYCTAICRFSSSENSSRMRMARS